MNLPYTLRTYQEEIIRFIHAKLEGGSSVAFESPTGTGKTITALVAAIEFARRKGGKKVLYVTRTNSQQEQVIKELRLLKRGEEIRAVPFQGRANLCLLYGEIEESRDFTSESLSRFCSLRKKKVLNGDQSACIYYNEKVSSPEVSSYIYSTVPDVDSIYNYGLDNVVCPYEALKWALRDAEIVIVPYALYLNPPVTAQRLLYSWGGVEREDLVVVLDEAHNIPTIARELASFEIAVGSVNASEREAQEYGDFELMPGYRTSDLCEMVRNAIYDIVRDKVGESEEVRIPFSDLREYIMVGNHISGETYDDLLRYLEIMGEFVAEQKEKSGGKVPRSRILHLYNVLSAWENVDEDRYVAVASSEGGGGKLIAACLDPPSSLLTPLKVSKTIHMSGTLAPPFDVYRDLTGFEDMNFLSVPYMFPRENRSIVYYSGLSTRFSEFNEETAERMARMIRDLISTVARNTLVFFPSYNVKQKVCGYLDGMRYLNEERDMSQIEVMDLVNRFRKGGGCHSSRSQGGVGSQRGGWTSPVPNWRWSS